ncbi:MAG: hypothetical protein NZL83_02430 [Candidatus Absconditabacterales bacterium]|nr:hypothetical protein [Candidatus Absconditabacterales bacterium]
MIIITTLISYEHKTTTHNLSQDKMSKKDKVAKIHLINESVETVNCIFCSFKWINDVGAKSILETNPQDVIF